MKEKLEDYIYASKC